MKLAERLVELTGHQVFFCTLIHGPDGGDIPYGVVGEVGDDYMLITAEGEEAGVVEKSSLLIRLDELVFIGHPDSCARCTADALYGGKEK